MSDLWLYEVPAGEPLSGDLQVRFQIYNYEAWSYRPLVFEEIAYAPHLLASWLWCHDRPTDRECRVYWGTHGCDLQRGHSCEHVCDCGAYPYYGPDTNFYGEDAPVEIAARG
jgi:hypothetical protein